MKGKLLLAIVVLAVLAIGFVSGKGARGGGSRGSSYRSSSYRSSSYRSSSYRATNFRSWPSSMKSTAAIAGTIYISRRLRVRYGYGKDWNDDLQVCRNEKKYNSFNGSTTQYGWFLCPTDDVQQDFSYCCGSDGEQYCCEYWKSGAGIGAIIGIVIGCIFFIIVVFFLIRFCLKGSKKMKRTTPADFSEGAVVYSNDTGAVTTKSNDLPPSYSTTFAQATPPYPQQQTTPYPQQQTTPYPPMPNSPPPAYPGVGAAAAPDAQTGPPPAVYSATS